MACHIPEVPKGILLCTLVKISEIPMKFLRVYAVISIADMWLAGGS